jgi:fermentation-respiration switch protein FrsA (DUF1100 family)
MTVCSTDYATTWSTRGSRCWPTTNGGSADPPGCGLSRQSTSWPATPLRQSQGCGRTPGLPLTRWACSGTARAVGSLRLGAQLGAPGHLILNSCPAVSFVDAEVFALTSAGAERDAAADLMRQLISTAQAGETYERGRDILTAYRNESWYAPALGEFTLNVDSWAQLGAWGDYTPDDDLARLQIPTLAIFGEKDPLVPVTASMARYDQSATNAPRVHRSVVFTDADHRLRTAGTEDFASGYLVLLSTWCRDPPAARRHARTSFT